MSAMKVVAFGIKSRHESMREFAAAFEAAQKGRRPAGLKEAVYFTSLAAVRNFLTPKRISLLKMVKRQNPRSIYALAKSAGRSFPSVLKDVELLSRYGLLKLMKEKNSPRHSVQARVSYDAIHLYVGI